MSELMNSTDPTDSFSKNAEDQPKTIQIRIDDVIKIFKTKEIEVDEVKFY